MRRLLLETELRQLDKFGVISRHKTGRAEQVGMYQTALRRLRRVILNIKVEPDKIKFAFLENKYLLPQLSEVQQHADGRNNYSSCV